MLSNCGEPFLTGVPLLPLAGYVVNLCYRYCLYCLWMRASRVDIRASDCQELYNIETILGSIYNKAKPDVNTKKRENNIVQSP